MDHLWQDIRYSFRRIGRNPALSLVIVISLALGIGVNAAVFSLVSYLLLRPLPVAEPEALVRVYTQSDSGRFRAFSYPDYLDLRQDAGALSGLAAERFVPVSFSTDGTAEMGWGQLVSGNYFSVVGVPAALGRTLLPADEGSPGSGAVAVLSDSFWRRRLNGDPLVVGRTVLLNGRPFTVVGVAPESFRGTFVGAKVDVWVPVSMQRQIMPVGDRLEQRGARWLTLTGRLEPGVTAAQAESRLAAAFERLAERHPDSNAGIGLHLVPFADDALPGQAKGAATQASILLLAVTAAVLLIACANLASVLLAQASARQREIAVRQALGAARKRLISGFVVESVLLALLGAGLALLLTAGFGRLIARLPLPAHLPFEIATALDWRVALFTLAVAVLVGLALGLLPALRSTRARVTEALKGEGFGRRAGKLNLRNLLVVGQVVLALVLGASAGLFVKSLRSSLAVDPGFDAERVLVAGMNLGLQGYDEERGRVWFRQLVERVAVLPGVEAASLGEMVPLELGGGQQMGVEIDGLTAEGSPLILDYNVVTPGYFETLGVPLLRGRDFEAGDEAMERWSVVVNETMAGKLWPGEDALGRELTIAGHPAQVVGIVADVRNGRLSQPPTPFMYLSFGQHYEPAMVLHVRSGAALGPLTAAVRRAVSSLDPNLPLYNVKPLDAQVRESLLPVRIGAGFLGAFGALALVLTAVGTYGVMAYHVSQRRHEMGVRLALGARPRDLLRRVFLRGIALVAAGAVIGLVLSLAASRFVASMLYGVSGGELAIFAAVAALLLAVASLAVWLPARRVTRLDPRTVLASE